jgi:hypothetical protein
MEQLAEKLLESEVIFSEDVERILGKRPFNNTPEGVKSTESEVIDAQSEEVIA